MFSFKRIPKRLSILLAAVTVAVVVTGFAIGDAKKDPLVVTMEAMMIRYQTLVKLDAPDCATGSTRRFIPANDPVYNKFFNDLIAFKTQIEKETFLRANLESDHEKITILGPVMAVYVQLQKGLLTNYFMQAHRDPNGVAGYVPDAMDVLNLKISTKAGTTLLDNAKYGLRDSIRHVGDGHGSYFMVEVFLTPAMVIDAEIVALQYPGNKIDYTKLVLASMLRQTIVNRWSLNRMISEVGYDKYYGIVSSCAKNLVSFRMGGQKITDGKFYQSLRQEDRYDDFRSVIPKIAEGFNGHPVLGPKLTGRAMREFLTNAKPVNDHIELMSIDRKLADEQVDSLHVPLILVYENKQMELDEEKEVQVGKSIIKAKMVSRSKQIVDEHVYPADDLRPEFLSKRLALHGFEERRLLLAAGILDRLKSSMGAKLTAVSKPGQAVAFDAVQEGIDEEEKKIQATQGKDVELEHSSEQLAEGQISNVSPPPSIAPSAEPSAAPNLVAIAPKVPDCTESDCLVPTVRVEPSPTPDPVKVAQEKADKELFAKQLASQAKLLAYLDSPDATTRALKIVSRISEESKKAWLEAQAKALEPIIATEMNAKQNLTKNLDRLKQYADNLRNPAQEGVWALQNKDKIQSFIQEKMTKLCSYYTQNLNTGLYWCKKQQDSEAYLGRNDPKSFWAYIGENPNRLSWKKYNSLFDNTERSLSALKIVAAEQIEKKKIKPLFPITPDEVSMLFGLKLQRAKTLRAPPVRDYTSGFQMNPPSDEAVQLRKIAKSKITAKFMKRYFAKLSEKFNKAVKDRKLDSVTEENTPLRDLMGPVAKEIYTDFMTAVTTPPGSRKSASPLLGDGLAIFKTFKPLLMPAVDNTYVRKSAEQMMAMACHQEQLAYMKKEAAAETKDVEGAMEMNSSDANYDPSDYQPDAKKLDDVLDSFRNALAVVGVYKEATGGALVSYTKKRDLAESIGWWANAVDLLDQQIPGMLPHERMAASIWDQLLMSEIKISSVQAEMPILGAEIRNTNYTDDKNTILYALRDEFKDRSLNDVDFEKALTRFTYQALDRDSGRGKEPQLGKIEEFCSVDVNKRKDSTAFQHMYYASSALREALIQGNGRLKRFDKELKQDAKTWTERAIDQANWLLMRAMIAIVVLFALSGIGALPASWMIAMGMISAEAAAAAVAAGTMWGLTVPGAWVAGFIWLNLTTNYLSLFIVGTSYTGLASRAFFYEQPRQLSYLADVANSQFGIMGAPTVSRADLIARRQELHMNQAFTVLGIALDVTFIKIFTIPEVKRLIGKTGRDAAMRLTEGQPALRRQLLRETWTEIMDQHGFRKGFPIYMERLKPWLKGKRANPLKAATATEEAILSGASIALSKSAPNIDELLDSHVLALGKKVDQAEEFVAKYGRVIAYIEGNATIAQQIRQYWGNLRRKYGWRGRFWRVNRAANADKTKAELDFAKEMTDDGKLTTSVLRAYEYQMKHQQLVQEVMREEQAIAVLTKIKEMVGSAPGAYPATYHYFENMSMDEMLREKAHFTFMKKHLGDDGLLNATKQTYKDLEFVMKDFNGLSPETVALLLKYGVTALRDDGAESMVVIAKKRIDQHLDANGLMKTDADGKVIEFDDYYTEFKVLPKALAEAWIKRAANAKGKQEFIYDAFIVDSKAVLEGESGWKLNQSVQKLIKMAKRAGIRQLELPKMTAAVTAEEQYLIELVKRLEARQAEANLLKQTGDNGN